MTLLARDEADIVDAQIAFHLHAGVDFVIATDNRSEDETTEILERYERAGYLHLIREDGLDIRQEVWVTSMARLAAAEFGADWVLNTDADEFWWPRGGSLKEVLETIPERFGVVRGCWRHFLPRPDDDAFFAERMTVRLRAPAFPGDKRTVYHAHQKVAHRADANVTVELGNHNAIGKRLEPLRSWLPIEVLHFSFRSLDQLRRKGRGGWHLKPQESLAQHQVELGDAYESGRLEEFLRSFVVDDDALSRGLVDGTLAFDTRLRDTLRALRTGADSFALPQPGPPLVTFARCDAAEDAEYAAESSVLAEIDGIVRSESRLDSLDERLSRLEREPHLRLRAKLLSRTAAEGSLRRLARP